LNKEPTGQRRRKSIGVLLWLVGLVAAVLLVVQQGPEEVAAATAVAGWGVLWIALIQFLPMMADTMAWWQLLQRHGSTAWAKLFWVRWIGESVNNLLPAARVGGEFLRAWLAYRKVGITGAVAGASVIVDLTMVIATQFLFTLVGLALLVLRGASETLMQAAAIGAGVLLAMLASFLVAQKSGVFVVLQRAAVAITSRAGWLSVAPDAQSLTAEVKTIYGRRRRLGACALWHLAGWLAGTLEVWAALWFLGHPVTFGDALMLESLIQAVRSAAFFMPGALGVQEGGLILLGAVVGLAPEVALALSLIKRIRELAVGLPALLAWQMVEGHRLVRPLDRGPGG
jgi:putative membrane protein